MAGRNSIFPVNRPPWCPRKMAISARFTAPPMGGGKKLGPPPFFRLFRGPPWIDRKNSATPPISAAYCREFRAVSPGLKRWLRETPSSEQIRRSAAQPGPGRSPWNGHGLGAGGLQPMESAPRPPVASAIRAAAAGHGLAWGFFPPYKVSLYGEI